MVRLYEEWTAGQPVGAGLAIRLAGDRLVPQAQVVAGYAAAVREAGLLPEHLVVARQVHGSEVRVVTMADAEPGIERRGHIIHPNLTCDALITTQRGVVVGVVTADCVPVLVYDTQGGGVGAAHAGWRGLAAGVLRHTVEALSAHCGTAPVSLRALIGPCICSRCFECGPEVAEAFIDTFGREAGAYVRAGSGDRVHVDLPGLARLALREAGLADEAIVPAQDCTRCLPDIYWSHRAHGLQRGNQLSFIALT